MTPEAKRKKNQKKKLKQKQKKAAERLTLDGQEQDGGELAQDQALESVPTSTEDLASEQELSLVGSEPVNISYEVSGSTDTPKPSIGPRETISGGQNSITLETIPANDELADPNGFAPHARKTVEEEALHQEQHTKERQTTEENKELKKSQINRLPGNENAGDVEQAGESIDHEVSSGLQLQDNASANKEVYEQTLQTPFETNVLMENDTAEYESHIDETPSKAALEGPLCDVNKGDQTPPAPATSKVFKSEGLDEHLPHITRVQEEVHDISAVAGESTQYSEKAINMHTGGSSIESNLKQEIAPHSFASIDSDSPLYTQDLLKERMLASDRSEGAMFWDNLKSENDCTLQRSIPCKSEASTLSRAENANEEGISLQNSSEEEVGGQGNSQESSIDNHLANLFPASQEPENEVMPWESSENDFLPTQDPSVIKSNDEQNIATNGEAELPPTIANRDEKIPTVNKDQFHGQNSILSFPDNLSGNERMPWDTLSAECQTLTDEKISLEVKNEPAAALSQQEELFPDEEYAGHEKMPLETSSHKKLGEEFAKSIEVETHPTATSQGLFDVKRPFYENGESQTEDSGSVTVETGAQITEEAPQVQSPVEEPSQLFPNLSEGNLEKMPWESGLPAPSGAGNSETSHSEIPPPNAEVKKFSFLDEDDDILDDDISDVGSFLESEEDDDQSSNLVGRQITEEASDSNLAQSIGSGSSSNYGSSVQNANRQSTTSVSSHGRLNRYEPSRMPQNTNVPFSENDRYSPAQNLNNMTVGIVPPQPIQPVMTNQQVDVTAKQEVFKKFKEEKKKSDAYDFPMDLVPHKNKLVHAKPVSVPTQRFISAPSFGSVPEIPSKVSTPSNPGGPSGIRTSTIPANPYAIIPPNPQEKPSHAIQLPPQGIVMPQVSLPSSNQIMPPKGPPKTSFNTQCPPPIRPRGVSNVSTSSTSAIRSRGFSNVSQTIGSPTGGPGIVTSIPFPSNVVSGSSISQMPKPASKYAPSSPINNLSSYGPVRRLSNNLSPVINPPMNNIESVIQGSHPPSLGLKVPTTVPASNVISPTSAASTRRYHARSNSSVYAPNQNEHTSKYAPTVHPQYQNAQLQHQYPLHQKNPIQPNFGIEPAPSKWSSHYSGSNNSNHPDIVLDNQALMHKQFPIFSWGGTGKIVYAIPAENSQDAYIMGSGSTLQDIKVVNADAIMPRNHLLQSFPGPLVKNKTKKKDIEKWLENTCSELPLDESSIEKTLLTLLKIKISESATWHDISNLLYNSDELLIYLSQPFMESQRQPTAYKLDANNQMKILAHLQTGGQKEALELALQNNDYSIALLIGSLMGKEKWSEVVQNYLTNEFTIESDVSHFSANLLPLIFQVFVGNSKTAIKEFSSSPQKLRWALENWKIIVAAILNNINLSIETSTSSIHEVPPVVFEFLVEFGLFLAHEGLSLQACVVFIIANLPLSPMPLANSPIKFEYIGNPNTLESAVYSELYEFICSKDPKGFPILLKQKLHQAFCYQELGMSANAARYVDYLSAALKGMPKKDAHTVIFARYLDELSVKISGTSTGWLGKPKLSSVWGQLDKSFNKYIGGDDDAIIKKPAEKKVFDGFTPVSSRNSSMLDVSQYQFTPFQASTQQQFYGNRDNGLSSNGVNQSPVGNIVSSTSGQPNMQAIHGSLTEPITHYMPRKISQSSQGSPQKALYIHPKSAAAENPKSQLRRVQTEQLGQKEHNVNDIYKGSSALKIYQSQETQSHMTDIAKPPISEFVPPPSLSHASMHYNSTPNLLRRESSSSTDVAPPPKIKSSTSRQFSPNLQRVKPVYSPKIPPGLLQPGVLESAVHVEKVHQAGRSSFSEGEKESLTTGAEHLATGRNSSTLIPATGFNEQRQSPEVLQEVPNEESDMSIGQADTTVLQSEFPISGKDTWRSPNQEFVSVLPLRLQPEKVSNSFNTSIAVEADDPSANKNSTNLSASPSLHDTAELTLRASEARAQPSIRNNNSSKMSSPINPYAPPHAFDVGSNPYAPKTASINTSPTRRAYVPSQNTVDQQIQYSNGSVGADQDMEDEHPMANSEDTPATKKMERFDPIKAPDALSPETFVPVIKAPAGRSFTPRVQSPEIQYDDIVEDESESEDEGESIEREARSRRETEERKKLEEEEKRRQKEQKEQLQKEREKENLKSRSNNEGQDKSNAWFGWLKKDSNEKKPIKAKLGHKKSTFYYDEKLKRWVNKNSSEEEKEKLSSPPPPPPVVKRMDNGPKTKPQSGREISKEPVGPILPNNPLTGQAMLSNVSSPPQSSTPLESLTVTPQLPLSNISLSGKKANGLDELLTLAGAGTAPRRKKRSARGYVNVMENT